ncbi:MAG: tetratricopeptide repeat protein [Planctomycetota bacterium]
MRQKHWVITVAVIVLVTVAYFFLGFMRGVSYYNRGTVHIAKGEYDQAIACFYKALAIAGDFPEAYCNRGTAYYEKGQCDLAISDFDKAIELNPDFAEAYYNRAVARYDKGEYDKARADVQKAQSLGHRVPSEFLKALEETAGAEK